MYTVKDLIEVETQLFLLSGGDFNGKTVVNVEIVKDQDGITAWLALGSFDDINGGELEQLSVYSHFDSYDELIESVRASKINWCYPVEL